MPASSKGAKAPSRLRNLALLATCGGVRSLVVPVEQQDDSISVGVEEDPQQDLPRTPGPRFGASALEAMEQLGEVIAKAKLAQPLAQLLAELSGADADAEHLQRVPHPRPEGGTLLGGEIVPDPIEDRLRTALVLPELDVESPFRHGSSLRDGRPSSSRSALRAGPEGPPVRTDVLGLLRTDALH